MGSNLKIEDGDIVNNWYIICLSQELKMNSILKRTVYDQDFVVYRDVNEKPVVLIDRCIHRGVQLSKGRSEKGEIVCPYHGWKYGVNGQVTEIPSEKNPNLKNLCGITFPVIEKSGAIWIWTGDKNKVTETPSWTFPYYGAKNWTSYFMVTDFENEVNHLVQNFMDVPHTVFVHSKWFRNRKLMKVPIEITVNSGRVLVKYVQPKDSIGFVGFILNPKNNPMIHTDEFIFPNITRVDYLFGNQHFIINSQCTPISKGRTRVYTWICYHLGFIGFLLKPFMQSYTRKVITQDVEIMENHGVNLKKEPSFFNLSNYRNTSADELHIAIEKLRSQGKEDKDSIMQINYKKEREFWI